VSELLGADTDVLERKAESLISDARRLQDIRTLAQRALGELQASWNGSDLAYLTQQWEQQTSPLLAGASVSLDTCAARLRAQSAAQRVTSSSDGSTSSTASGFVVAPVSPPWQGSPADNAAWWKSMTALQQQQVLREHPEWIGNRDGVDFTARDLANRALLPLDRDRLIAERERLEADLADNRFGGDLTNDDEALDHVNDKLASITAIELTLARTGERQLILLDLSKERAQAAIANGNVQTADNVAVFVPGMTTTVTDSMKGSDESMRQLQKRSTEESRLAYPAQALTAATVTWIGYQAPQWGAANLTNPGTSVLFDNTAKKGAAQLVPFLQGIDSARDRDAHLTLLGHSYGTTTAGLALQQDTGVDDVVFFGSPGIGTDHVRDLNLAPGHAYYIETQQDWIGDTEMFGPDLSVMNGVQHPSAEASTVVDPKTGEIRVLSRSMGHSEYLLDNSTSQYNMSVVVAGAPERQVPDPAGGAEANITGRHTAPHR
jgi:Alpha/beta hydrolase